MRFILWKEKHHEQSLILCLWFWLPRKCAEIIFDSFQEDLAVWLSETITRLSVMGPKFQWQMISHSVFIRGPGYLEGVVDATSLVVVVDEVNLEE